MSLRILLTYHLPLDWPDSRQNVGRLADELRRRGHSVRCLIVDQSRPNGDDASVRRVVCNPDLADADLKFRLPTFSSDGSGQPGTTTFTKLTDDELLAYRDVLRDALDNEVADFNPHIVHGQHVWILGHLALEAGVPYLLTARGPELDVQARDSRYRRYAQEAAENAGRIVVADDAVQRAVTAAFGELDHRVVLVPDSGPEPLERLYDDVLRARFGGDFRP